LSFSQLSQRYVDESNVDFIMPPALKDNTQIREESNVDEFVFDARLLYTNLVRVFLKQGLSRKEAREAARCVLPNMTETRIVVTGNHRTWREVIAKRAHPAADAEIQELARELLRQLKLIAPATYQDM
jgi:thymidylate synthase (FAD)